MLAGNSEWRWQKEAVKANAFGVKGTGGIGPWGVVTMSGSARRASRRFSPIWQADDGSPLAGRKFRKDFDPM